MPIRLAFAVLAICGAGAFTGSMLTIGVTLGGSWQNLAPATFLDWWGANEMLIVRSITSTAGPAAVGVLASLLLSLRQPPARMWWSAAALALIALGVITAVFHLPINASFAGRTVPLEQVADTIDRWLMVHYVRIALGLVATVAGIVAVTRPSAGVAAGR